MRSPLALLKVTRSDGFYWRVVFTAASARGFTTQQVLYIRDPTEDEREDVEAGLPSGTHPFFLDTLITKAP